ncbi:Uncharacterised protein [Mycobacterium tuberculosis]|nr:Uncharacterised protein [Mycobacterium tuberculosis]
MPGRFREGTETCIRKVRTLETLPTCRQTQNPERGRKRPVDGGCVVRASVVRPKTPRGDGNARNRPTWACPQRVVRPKTPRGDGNTETQHQPDNLILASSDPKPREGTETLMVGHGRARLSGSSDPKPREGTETGRRIAPGAGGAAVVRPKTPRGDGNAYRPPHHSHATAPCPQTQNPERGRKHTADDSYVRVTSSQSSDPKPREGTET